MAELPRPLPPPSLRDRFEGWRTWLPDRPTAPLIAFGVVVLVTGVLLFALAGGGVSRWRPSNGPDVALSLPTAAEPASEESATTTTVSTVLHVHAAGAVVQPGVVTVPSGSRVADVVAAAGGPAPNADLDQVNLAAPVADGERVYVPHQGEIGVAAAGPANGSGKTEDAIVNINQADETQLESLPGVGPATAKAIVDYRNEHGRFRSVDDLLNVRGIGPSKLSQIKPHARV